MSTLLLVFMHWFSAEYLIWGHFLSVSKYSFAGLIVNEYSGQNFSACSDEDNNCFDSGEEVLEYYEIDDVEKWSFLLYNALFYVGFSILTYLGLVFIRYEKR